MQAKLMIGPPGDAFEQEADRAADDIASGQSAKRISRLPGDHVGQSLHRSEQRSDESESRKTDLGHIHDAGIHSRIESPSGGHALPESVRRNVESGLGADLAHVRVHDSAEDQSDAHLLSAKAFTHGNHIWLGPGQSAHDTKLIAHEAAHVVQQGAASKDEHSVQRKPAG
ncbi:MAG: DUF4157 domain-containing protein, partial [Deltaproteobacteria bacterium]|nr:DUF4157 domain-containing protein [Deltaproteobacteria bacterium]